MSELGLDGVKLVAAHAHGRVNEGIRDRWGGEIVECVVSALDLR